MGGALSALRERLGGGSAAAARAEEDLTQLAGLDQDDADLLAVISAYTEPEIRKLWRIFHSVDVDNSGKISREELMGLNELRYNPLGQRVVSAAFDSHRLEREKAAKKPGYKRPGSSGGISEAVEAAEAELNFKDFIHVLSPFAAGASADTKLRLAFTVYDFDGDKRLGKSDLSQVLRQLLPKDAPGLEDLVEHVVEVAMREADVDGDGVLDYEEFKKAVANSDIKAKLTFNL